ncbi:unnamed protein product [Amoebophrya sp. A120]|nr:unnamed protein product [Amoebophrya sp. A120]|eukprot:GSA120T00002504001.1
MDRDQLFTHVAREITALLEVRPTSPHVLGLQAPQGFGKTFLVQRLEKHFGRETLLTLSLDDFYLPAGDLRQLATRNPLWRNRGLPGTHDVGLLRDVLAKIRRCGRAGTVHALADTETGQESASKVVELPRFDKTLNAGFGDRVSGGSDRRDLSQVRVVLLDGWCVGFRSPGKERKQDVDLESWTYFLEGPGPVLTELEKVWDEYIDGWIVVELPLRRDGNQPEAAAENESILQWVVKWRTEAEEKAAAAAKRNMLSPAQVAQFCEPYLVCYKLCALAFYDWLHRWKGGESHEGKLLHRFRVCDAARNVEEVDDAEDAHP